MGLKSAVVFLVLAVGGILLQVEAASVQPDFQQEQFAGQWYSIAMASNSRWFKDKKAVMKMCTTRVTSLEDGNLDVTSTYPTHGQCETRRSLFIRASQPGRFKYTSQRSGSHFEVSVAETDYDRYALLTSKKTAGAESSVMVMLYGRSKELPAEYLEKFTQLCLAESLTQDEILFLPTTDLCMEDVV